MLFSRPCYQQPSPRKTSSTPLCYPLVICRNNNTQRTARLCPQLLTVRSYAWLLRSTKHIVHTATLSTRPCFQRPSPRNTSPLASATVLPFSRTIASTISSYVHVYSVSLLVSGYLFVRMSTYHLSQKLKDRLIAHSGYD
jgi:hypothetical protein